MQYKSQMMQLTHRTQIQSKNLEVVSPGGRKLWLNFECPQSGGRYVSRLAMLHDGVTKKKVSTLGKWVIRIKVKVRITLCRCSQEDSDR